MGNYNFENVEETMPRFIEVFYKYYKAGRHHVNWSSHAHSYLESGNNVLLVKYESLLNNGVTELKKITEWLGYNYAGDFHKVVDKFSFENISNRKQGSEKRNSFLRKGISGDWKNYFNHEAQVLFNEYHGEMLERLGYD